MSSPAFRLLVVVVVIALVATAGRWWQQRGARVRSADGRFDPRQLAAVGLDAQGADALALLLGSPTCAPCERVKRVLTEVSVDRPGLRWVHADAAAHLDLARAHHVLRVPTLFVLSPDGRILARTSGVPAARDLVQVLDRDTATAAR